MKKDKILLTDAVINFLLGLLLLFYSKSITDFLGVPFSENKFYPTILGAILIGIGFALLIEYIRKPNGLTGLGLGGAIVINMCGGIALACWLIWGHLDIPTKGSIFLWILVFILVGISTTELFIFKVKEK